MEILQEVLNHIANNQRLTMTHIALMSNADLYSYIEHQRDLIEKLLKELQDK